MAPSGAGYGASERNGTYHDRAIPAQRSDATIGPGLQEVAPGHYVARYEIGRTMLDGPMTEEE